MPVRDVPASGALVVEDLGQLDYAEAWERQRAQVEARIAGEAPDTLLLVEHPAVYTLGRRRGAEGNLLDVGDTPVLQVERGGDVTWHGPGQLVAYPIVALPEGRRDILRHLRDLEDAVIATLAALGVEGGRDERNTGVWVRGRKVCSIGVACRSWVTWHGLALNVNPDMTAFSRINPCGLDTSVMTCLAWEMAEPPTVDAVKPLLVAQLRAVLCPTPG